MNIGPYVHSGVPQVLSLHNAYQVYPFEYTRYHPKNRIRVSALRWFFRRSLAASDGVIVQTNLMRDYLLRFRRAPRQVVVIPKAVESERDAPALRLPDEIIDVLQNGPGRGWPTFLYAATAEPHKDHKTVGNAVEILRRRGRNVRLVLTVDTSGVIAAAGADSKSLVESGHIGPLGWVRKEHLKSLYQACDFCVMPSLLESLSSAYLEAMKWSRPQICSDLPFSRDICGCAAIYARPGDPQDWANQMERLLDDTELQRRLIALGQQRMKSWPESWVEVARNVSSFLAQVAGHSEIAETHQPNERMGA
jgi:glycosyltransferase involved in cell wall biosynthesis